MKKFLCYDTEQAARGKINVDSRGMLKPVDSELSDTSTNPVQNKVIKSSLDALSEEIADGVKAPSAAEVGQTIVVKAVDENGKPTEWEAVDGRSDWSENDESSAGYVKNRPFWMEDPVETILLDETELNFENGPALIDVSLPLVEGDTYTVIYNGVVYECVAWNFKGQTAIGNGELAGVKGGNGEPFIFAGNMALSTDTHALVKIVVAHREIHKISNQYLPDTLFRYDGIIFLDQDNETYEISNGIEFKYMLRSTFYMNGILIKISQKNGENEVCGFAPGYIYLPQEDKIKFYAKCYHFFSDGTYTVQSQDIN